MKQKSILMNGQNLVDPNLEDVFLYEYNEGI